MLLIEATCTCIGLKRVQPDRPRKRCQRMPEQQRADTFAHIAWQHVQLINPGGAFCFRGGQYTNYSLGYACNRDPARRNESVFHPLTHL